MNCRRFESLLETHVDGELPPEQTLEVEAHLDACERCTEQARLLHALKGSMRRSVQRDMDVSADFLSRVQTAIAEEELRQRVEYRPRPWYGGWRSSLPALGMAAGVLVWFGLRGVGSAPPSAGAPIEPEVTSASLGMEGALDRLIHYHSSPPQPQVTEPGLLPALEPNVGVRVQAPHLEAYGATWEGASLVPLDKHQAAYMRYRMPGHRVTVYVYDPRKVPVHHPLERRVVGTEPIYVGQWRGYSVAARENRGVGYAMAADLDAQELTQLISAIH